MRTLCFVALLGVAAPVLAQEPAAARESDAIEEVVVPGRRPENLRVEVERLERVVYQRWNALNSNDELDIFCLESEPTGSNITQTRCAPNFVIQAEAREAKNSIVGARSNASASSARNTRESTTRFEQKSRELTEEMRRIAREDEQFMRDLVRLDELKQLQASDAAARGADR